MCVLNVSQDVSYPKQYITKHKKLTPSRLQTEDQVWQLPNTATISYLDDLYPSYASYKETPEIIRTCKTPPYARSLGLADFVGAI
jgi:hypothetical protein